MNDIVLSRRDLLKVAGGIGLASLLSLGRSQGFAAPPKSSSPTPKGNSTPKGDSPYSKQVLALEPVGYWRLGEKKGPTAADSSKHHNEGTYHGKPKFGEPGAIRSDHDTAVGLNGSSYVEIPSHAGFSVGSKGLTVEVWLRPDLLNFPCEAHEPYIHWLGKGEKDHFEWGFRFYKKDSNRPNRISAYIWNADGKLGSGAYFEEPVTPGKWIHVVAVYQAPGKDAGVLIYRNGESKKGPPDAPTLYRTYGIKPTKGPAPLRLGTRDLESFLRGGLDEVAIYPRCLTAAEIRTNYRLATDKAVHPKN